MPNKRPQARWLSITALAKLRDKSKPAIHERVRRFEAEGLLKTRRIGREVRVNVAAFDKACALTMNPARSAVSGEFHQSRARRESFTAEMARLDLEERLAGLCSAAEVERRTRAIVLAIRSRMLALPAAIARRVRAAPDERAVRAIVDEETRVALTALAEEFERAAETECGESA